MGYPVCISGDSSKCIEINDNYLLVSTRDDKPVSLAVHVHPISQYSIKLQIFIDLETKLRMEKENATKNFRRLSSHSDGDD